MVILVVNDIRLNWGNFTFLMAIRSSAARVVGLAQVCADCVDSTTRANLWIMSSVTGRPRDVPVDRFSSPIPLKFSTLCFPSIGFLAQPQYSTFDKPSFISERSALRSRVPIWFSTLGILSWRYGFKFPSVVNLQVTAGKS